MPTNVNRLASFNAINAEFPGFEKKIEYSVPILGTTLYRETLSSNCLKIQHESVGVPATCTFFSPKAAIYFVSLG